jgi:hypothetical protein
MRWLASHTWFIPGNDKRAENFPLAVKHLLKPIEFRRQVMLKLIDSTNAVSLGYQHLGRLWGDGYFQTVLTTNFDRCLLRAYQAQEGAAQVSEVHRWDGDYAQFEPSSRRRQLVWLHGNVQNYTARTTPDEVSQLSGNLVSKLRPLLDHAPLVVIGYRGAEASIMHHLLLDKNRGEMNYAKGIYWCVLRGEALHPNVEQLSAALGDNFHLLEIDGFDQLMTALAEEFVELPARTWFEAVLCRRVALASLLVKDLHSDPHFGRTKLAKLFYLIDMSGDLDFATHYSRAKNGPLDERAMYNERIGIEAMAKRHELFTTETVGRRTRYIPLNLHAMERLIAEHLGSKAAEMRSLAQRLAPMRVDQVEILTTLYACWNDLLIRRWPASDDAIITAFLDWHPAKKRFRARLPNALVWMRNQNLVPQGRDRPTEQRPPRDF